MSFRALHISLKISGRRRVRVTFAPNHKNMEPDDELHVFFVMMHPGYLLRILIT